MNGEGFLKNKFPTLHASSEVESAVKRYDKKTEEKVSRKPEERIKTYLDRFAEILNRPESKEMHRGVEALKQILFKENVIAEANIPERVYELEQEVAFNQGHGQIEITDEYRIRKNQEIIAGQKDSLSSWVDYLSSKDALYPMWAKYWVMNSILKVGKYNKEKRAFDKRGKNSVATFPPMNTGAVAKAISVIQEKIKNGDTGEIKNFSNLEDEEFQRVLNKEDFAKIYALALESMPEFSEVGMENIKGEWVRYEQIPYQEEGENGGRIHSQTQRLFDSLQGYPLEWCTGQNIDTAETQLKGGDFHVYYSENNKGENKIPRVAIRMEANQIAEVRGIEANQNMDRYILPVVEGKMGDFGEEGEKYKKRVGDMTKLTEIYNRSFGIKDKETGRKESLRAELSPEELDFIYELNGQIEGFGNEKDPRINEIIINRGATSQIQRDVAMIFQYFENKNSEYEKYEDKYGHLEDLLAKRKTSSRGSYQNQGTVEELHERNLHTHINLVKRLIESIPREYWKDIIKYFGHSQDVLDLLIKNDGGDLIMANWEEISAGVGVDKLTEFFIDNKESRRIISNLKRLYKPTEYYSIIERVLKYHAAEGSFVGDGSIETIMNIDESIVSIPDKAKLFIETGVGSYIFRYWDKFRVLDQNGLARSLMEHEQSGNVVYNMEKFDHLDKDVAQSLVTILIDLTEKGGNAYDLISCLKKLKDTHVIKTQTAKTLIDRLLDKDAFRYIKQSLSSFENPVEVKDLFNERRNTK